jgi:hypothetical protein
VVAFLSLRKVSYTVLLPDVYTDMSPFNSGTTEDNATMGGARFVVAMLETDIRLQFGFLEPSTVSNLAARLAATSWAFFDDSRREACCNSTSGSGQDDLAVRDCLRSGLDKARYRLISAPQQKRCMYGECRLVCYT